MASKVVKQLAGNGTGQSLADRVNAAKYSLAGSGLGKGVIKATTEEIVPPKKKHLDYLTNCTNEVNVSIPELAEYLIDRMQQTSAVVVMKTFITTHHLLNFGNEKFSQYLAAKDNQLYLPGFVDKSSPSGYELSQYVKMYSKYVNEKAVTYRLMAFDFCKIKRGRDDGVLRRMPIDKLMKALPILQGQIDILVEFDATSKDLNNPVLMAAFTLMYKDLIRLFASYNEGMINLIELYFTMARKMCEDALVLYKAFMELTEKVLKFVTIAESAGVGDKASLGFQAVPPKVLETLENHLANLEKNKTSQSDSDGSSNATLQPNILLPSKHEKGSTNITKKSNESRAKPDRARTPVPKPEEESNSHDLLNDLFNNTPENDGASNSTPVRTQLRRPEQQQSVAVTVQRAGRSPSPNRPARPPQNRSRDPSPAMNDPSSNKTSETPDFFLNLRDDSSHVAVSPSTPNTERISPFAGDEKTFVDSGSFWNNNAKNNDQNNDVDFESAFKDGRQGNAPAQAQHNLLDMDLLGLNMDDQPSMVPSPHSQSSHAGHSDLDDLLSLGSSNSGAMGNAPLIPSGATAVATKSIPDDLMDSFSYTGHNSNTAANVQQKANTTNIPNKSTTPAKNADANLSDTLALLADSLGKGDNKWSSNTKKSTLTGNTIDLIGMSSGPTIDWSKSSSPVAAAAVTTTSNESTTATSTTNNNNNYNLLDLLG